MIKLLLAFALSSTLIRASEVSIKDFRELYESLKASMNLDPGPSDAIKKQYDSIFEILPPSGNVNEYNASMQWALTKLTSEFCRERIKKDAVLPSNARWIHRQVDFSASPQAQTGLSMTLNEYTDVFWQRALKTDEETISNDFASRVATELPDTASALVPYLTSLCTIIGTSTDAIAFH